MAKRLNRISEVAALLIPITISFALWLFDPMPARALRDIVFDSYQRHAPRESGPPSPVVVVDVDDESLSRVGQWPWPRDTMAKLLGNVAADGPLVVGFDILFAEADRTSPEALLRELPALPERDVLAQALAQRGPSHDALFATALGSVPSVLGVVLSVTDKGTMPPSRGGFALAGDDPRPWLPFFRAAVMPMQELAAAAAGLGGINWTPDRDLVVRRVPLLFNVRGTLVPSLALEMLRVAQGRPSILVRSSNASAVLAFGAQRGVDAIRVGTITIPTDPDGSLRLRYGAGRPERRVPAWRVLEATQPAGLFAKGFVIVGTSAAALADIRATPLQSDVPGIAIHAEVLEELLTGQSLTRTDVTRGAELMAALLAAFFAWWAARELRPGLSAGLVAGAAMVLAGAGWWLFASQATLFDPLFAILLMASVHGGTTLIIHRRSEEERREIKKAFGRYVSPEIVERLAANPSQLRLGGETRAVTVLFSDIRGFTSMSEDMPAENVIGFLNRIHTPLTAEIVTRRGTIDKYVGDGLMAFWNAPHESPNHASLACSAALAMVQVVDRIRAGVQAEAGTRTTLPSLAIGMGINTGPASVGNIGSDMRFDYSIVGDTVNVAARLQQLSKVLRVQVLVTEAVKLAAPRFLFIPLVTTRLRGRRGETLIYALVGEQPAGPAMARFIKAHVMAFSAVTLGDADADDLLTVLEAQPEGEPFAEIYRRWRLVLAGAPSMVPEAVDPA